MRISVFGLNFVPETTGIAPYTLGMCTALADAGHEVTVITGKPHYPSWKRVEGYSGFRLQERHKNLHVVRVEHTVPKNPLGFERLLMEATFALNASLVSHAAPDRVIAISPALLSVAGALRHVLNGRRVPLGVVVQDIYSSAIRETGGGPRFGGHAAAMLEGALLRRADGVVAVHPQFQPTLERLGVSPDRISIIRNWTHVGSPSTADRSSVRREMKWKDEDFIVLHAGNMGAKQGLENVIRAAARQTPQEQPIRFVLMGDGSQRRKLEDLAESNTNIEIAAPVTNEKFANVLHAADVLLLNELPALVEMSVPSKLTSYFAAGRPVLAATSPQSAAASEIRDSGGGICVTPGAPDDLLNGARFLRDNSETRLALGLAGQEYAASALHTAQASSAYTNWAEALHHSKPAT